MLGVILCDEELFILIRFISCITFTVLSGGHARMLFECSDKVAVRTEIQIIADVQRGVIRENQHIFRCLYTLVHDKIRYGHPNFFLEQL